MRSKKIQRVFLRCFSILLIFITTASIGSSQESNLKSYYHYRLYIDRVGLTRTYSGMTVTERWDAYGYIDFLFTIPHAKWNQNQWSSYGTGMREIQNCGFGECVINYIVYKVDYKVLDYKPVINVRNWEIVGWRVKIKEYWHNGYLWGHETMFGQSMLMKQPDLYLEPYWVRINLVKNSYNVKSRCENHIVDWVDKFHAKLKRAVVNPGAFGMPGPIHEPSQTKIMTK